MYITTYIITQPSAADVWWESEMSNVIITSVIIIPSGGWLVAASGLYIASSSSFSSKDASLLPTPTDDAAGIVAAGHRGRPLS